MTKEELKALIEELKQKGEDYTEKHDVQIWCR